MTDGPIARVVVGTPLPHLDRPFDYLVPDELAEAAVPGVRVRVRFAGKLTDGFLLERASGTDHEGRLAPLERVVGTEPALTPEIARLARAVADRYAGTLSDVLRLAVPPRHATVERQASRPGLPVLAAEPASLDRYDGGPALLDRLAADPDAAPGPARAVWAMLPGRWAAELATAVAAVVTGGDGAVVVVPDARDVAHVGAALAAAVGPAAVVELAAGLGPQERYRRFLRILRGVAPVVVGTRAAVWAPVRRLRLVAVWDDGDDLLAEPRAPYPHARDVAVLRSHLAPAHLLLAGHAVSTDAEHLVDTGWAVALDPLPAARSAAWPRIHAAGEDAELAADEAARSARLPTVAWRAAHTALQAGGPVLVQVPRRGYVPRLACADCRSPARCRVCNGPLSRTGEATAARCAWCGTAAADWTCPHCGGTRLRATVVGARRTAEELGRAFPGVPVRTSGGGAVLDGVPGDPAVVVATPGAEPPADGGYTAALLLDGWVLLSRPDLRAAEETLRRWLAAAALVRPAAEGGRVVVMAPAELPVTQALISGRPRMLAARELTDRRALHLPPAARLAALTGRPAAVTELLGLLELPPAAEVLGPVELTAGPDGAVEQLLVRVPPASGRELARTLKAAAAARSARKAGDPVRITIDPVAIG
jgi:primosomal protein N' (replication factor Y)